MTNRQLVLWNDILQLCVVLISAGSGFLEMKNVVKIPQLLADSSPFSQSSNVLVTLHFP